MDLFYREFGSGNPLILLHGLFGSSDNWVTFAHKLALQNSLHVIVPDLRNHGQSPHHPVFSFDSMVDDLFSLIQKLQLNRPILMGHSLGGKIILNAFLDQPSFCKKAIIADMGLRQYTPRYGHVEILELMQSNDLSKFTQRKEVEEYVVSHLKDIRLQNFVLKNVYWKNKETLAWKINIEAINQYLPELFSGVNYPKPIDVPILFIKAALSDYINEEDKTLINKQFINSTITEVKDAGHWLHVDNPEGFYNAVNRMV